MLAVRAQADAAKVLLKLAQMPAENRLRQNSYLGNMEPRGFPKEARGGRDGNRGRQTVK